MNQRYRYHFQKRRCESFIRCGAEILAKGVVLKLGLISEVDCDFQQAANKKSCLHPLSFTFSQAIFLGGCFSAGYSDLFLGNLVKSQPRHHSTGFQEQFEISSLKLCHLFVLSRGPPSYALVHTVLRVLAVQFISFSALDR